MSDKQSEPESESESLPGDLAAADLEARGRREFLLSLGKWSKVVIGGVLLGGVLVPDENAKAWGGGPGGGAGLWYNSGRGWGGWVQQPWGWYDRPYWRRPPHWRGRPYWRHRPYWHDYGWYDRPWYNRPWYNGGWYNGWYNR